MKTNKISSKLVKKSILFHAIVPAAVVYFVVLALTSFGDKSPFILPIIPSIFTALVGWRNSVILGDKGFIRSENSKAKDSIANFVEKLFDELELKLHDRKFIKQAEDFITGKTTILELRLAHVKQRTKMELLSSDKLAKLRESSLTLTSDDNYSKLLNSLRFELLEDIENNYSDFFADQEI